jgi:hypothetical protein
MAKALGYTVGSILFIVVAFLMMDYAFSIPNVVESYSTGECVTVENYPGIVFNQEMYSCENMPSKFYHVYVK